MKTHPKIFCIKVKYPPQDHYRLKFLDYSYHDYLKNYENRLGVHFDYISVEKEETRIFCSSFELVLLEKNIEEAVEETSEKIFSMFDLKIETPIDVQWEFF